MALVEAAHAALASPGSDHAAFVLPAGRAVAGGQRAAWAFPRLYYALPRGECTGCDIANARGAAWMVHGVHTRGANARPVVRA